MTGKSSRMAGDNTTTSHISTLARIQFVAVRGLTECWCFLRGRFAERAPHSAAAPLGLRVSLLQNGSQVSARQSS